MESSNETQSTLAISTPSPTVATSTAATKPNQHEATTLPETSLSGRPTVQAKTLTGTYELVADNKHRKNTIKVLAVSSNELKIKFEGLWEYTFKGEPIANVGEAEGVVVLEGNFATLRPESKFPCSISFKFLPKNKLTVNSDCEFGQHVNASGQYIRRSKKPPVFDETN